mgnify:CR=1 FL=1
MRDDFQPNVRLAANIRMIIGTFLIAFNLSKISTRTRDWQIIEDCARSASNNMPIKELVKKYNLKNIGTQEDMINFL